MLPFELWAHICSFACLDDGYTARSLSRTSHLLQEAAEPFKWRVLSVHNARQIVNLTTHLESLPLQRRNVEFLFAACASQEYGAIPDLVEFYKPGICDRSPGPSPEDILDSRDELLTHAISRLLTAVRTTVRIVHIHSDDRDCVFYPVKFDRLEELTLEGHFDYTYRGYIASLPVNPTIKRLKFDNAELHSSSTLLDSIATYAPQATHLYCRIWSLYLVDLAIPELSDLLRPSSYRDGVDRPNFPSTLEKLYIHPGRSEPPGFCGTGFAIISNAKLALYEFSRMPELKARVVLLKEEKYKDGPLRGKLYQEEAREEWLDRIHGGLGCWDESDRMDPPY